MKIPNDHSQLAFAKVNLCLHITGKNPAGYHLLDSLVVFPEIGDIIRVAPATRVSLTIDGPFGAGLDVADNLVMQAAGLFGSSQGAALHLTKNLPVASGIGGGSSDAAAALTLLSRFWQKPMPERARILALGADVPVCMNQIPQRMQGIGEILTPVKPLPECAIVLANSGLPVSTGQVFNGLTMTKNTGMQDFGSFASVSELVRFLGRQRNDLQAAAIRIFPEIQNVINVLKHNNDCLLARMSGSGGTCFGLFENTRLAQSAAMNIAVSHPEWWVAAAKV